METKKTCKDCRKYIPSGMDMKAPSYCWEKSDICDNFIPKIGVANVLRTIISMTDKYHLTIKSPFNRGGKWIVVITPLGVTGWNGRPDFEGQGDELSEAVLNAVKAMEKRE